MSYTGMKTTNPDVPIEAVLKYIKQERDRYKEKLETLIPYTKTLERTLEQANKEKAALAAEVKALRKDYKHSDWFKDLQRQNSKLGQRNKELERTVSRLVYELHTINSTI